MECTSCFEAEMEERLVDGVDNIGKVNGMVCPKCGDIAFTHQQSLFIDNKRMFKRMQELTRENESLRVDMAAIKTSATLMAKELTSMSGSVNKKHFLWHVSQNCLAAILSNPVDFDAAKKVLSDNRPSAHVEQAISYANLLISRLEFYDGEKSSEVSAE